jgi:hypothetical protein
VPSLPHPLSYGKKRAPLPAGERHKSFFETAEKDRPEIQDILSVLHDPRLLFLNWRKDTTKIKMMQAVARKQGVSGGEWRRCPREKREDNYPKRAVGFTGCSPYL